MPILPGVSLHQRLAVARRHPDTHSISWAQKLDLAIDIARSVNALHCLPSSFGPVVHCDLKSPYVLLDAKGRAFIACLAQARVAHQGEEDEKEEEAEGYLLYAERGFRFYHFASSHRVGTDQWRAPEQRRPESRQHYTIACDMYSVGMVLWELAAEQEPWVDVVSGDEVVQRVQRGERPAMPATAPSHSRRWIERCCAHSAQERPSAAELLRDMLTVKARM